MCEEGAAAENRLFGGSFTPFVARVDARNAIKVFRQSGESIAAAGEYDCQRAAVIALCFAPIQYHSYMLCASDDQRLRIFDLERGGEPIFEFAVDEKRCGRLTAVEFLNCDDETLCFVAGTSAGIVLLFSSAKAFAEERVEAGAAAVRLLAAGPSGALAALCEGEDPRLFFEAQMRGFSEFGQPLHDDRRVCQLALPFQETEDGLLMLSADERGRLGLWRVQREEREVSLLKNFNIGFAPLSLAWNVSGFSALAIGYNEIAAKSRQTRIVRDFDERPIEEMWKLEEIELK